MNMFVHSLSLSAGCKIILANIKQETLLSRCSSHFFSLAWNLLLSAQRKLISRTSANGGVRLFVYFVCLCEWGSEWVSEWVRQEGVCLCEWRWMCMRWPTQWGLNWYHYQSLWQICDCSHRPRDEVSHCAGQTHTDMFKPGLWCLVEALKVTDLR